MMAKLGENQADELNSKFAQRLAFTPFFCFGLLE
jgi:hypothetical protein